MPWIFSPLRIIESFRASHKMLLLRFFLCRPNALLALAVGLSSARPGRRVVTFFELIGHTWLSSPLLAGHSQVLARWEVEILFKELKSKYALDVVPTSNPQVI